MSGPGEFQTADAFSKRRWRDGSGPARGNQNPRENRGKRGNPLSSGSMSGLGGGGRRGDGTSVLESPRPMAVGKAGRGKRRDLFVNAHAGLAEGVIRLYLVKPRTSKKGIQGRRLGGSISSSMNFVAKLDGQTRFRPGRTDGIARAQVYLSARTERQKSPQGEPASRKMKGSPATWVKESNGVHKRSLRGAKGKIGGGVGRTPSGSTGKA